MEASAGTGRRLTAQGHKVLHLELRLVPTKLPPVNLHRSIEPRLRAWRSLSRWTMATFQARREQGGVELVCQVVVERRSATKRADNVAVCWQKLIAALRPEGFTLQRQAWARNYADAEMHTEVHVYYDCKPLDSNFEDAHAQLRSQAAATAVHSMSNSAAPLLPI